MRVLVLFFAMLVACAHPSDDRDAPDYDTSSFAESVDLRTELRRLTLRTADDGVVTLRDPEPIKPLGHPFEKFWWRAGEATDDVTLDAHGRIVEPVAAPGRSFSGYYDLTVRLGVANEAIVELLAEKVPGPIFPDTLRPSDVEQWRHQNCTLVSLIAATAAVVPEQLRTLIDDNGDGSVTVRLRDSAGKKTELSFVPEPMVTQGQALTSRPSRLATRWSDILEEAVMKITQGTAHPSAAAVLGRASRYFALRTAPDAALTFEAKKAELAGKFPIALSDWDDVSLDLPEARAALDAELVALSAQRIPVTFDAFGVAGFAYHVVALVGVEERQGELYARLYDPLHDAIRWYPFIYVVYPVPYDEVTKELVIPTRYLSVLFGGMYAHPEVQ